jgi:hypothetical protein
VYAHGGARTGGDKARTVPKRLAAFAAHGVTVVSVDYRLAPDAVFPQQLRDLKGFWMPAHPRPEPRARHRRLGIWGASAYSYSGSLLEARLVRFHFRGAAVPDRPQRPQPNSPPSEGLSLHHAPGRAGSHSRFELLADARHEDAEFPGERVCHPAAPDDRW